MVHCVEQRAQGDVHAIANANIAFTNSADGIFLIGHHLHCSELRRIYMKVRKQFPQGWIGINFLDVEEEKDLKRLVGICDGVNALWIDSLPENRLDIDPGIEVFGGVAFKYINPDQSGAELAAACSSAMQTVNVITTSGNKTGSAPNTEKLKNIRANIGQTRLALASGVTAENAPSFLPYVDDFLVASSIIERNEQRLENFIPEKVRSMASIIHG